MKLWFHWRRYLPLNVIFSYPNFQNYVVSKFLNFQTDKNRNCGIAITSWTAYMRHWQVWREWNAASWQWMRTRWIHDTRHLQQSTSGVDIISEKSSIPTQNTSPSSIFSNIHNDLKTTRRCCGGFATSAPWCKWLYLLHSRLSADTLYFVARLSQLLTTFRAHPTSRNGSVPPKMPKFDTATDAEYVANFVGLNVNMCL